MSSSLLLILIVVVWLFVLLPLVVNTRKPIRRTSEALGKTRVLHRGGEELAATRRRPTFKQSDVRVADDVDDSLETVDAQVEGERDARASDEHDGSDVLIDDTDNSGENPAVVESDVVYELAAPAEAGADDVALDGAEEVAEDGQARDRVDAAEGHGEVTVRRDFVDEDDLMYAEVEAAADAETEADANADATAETEAETAGASDAVAGGDDADGDDGDASDSEGVLVDDTLTDTLTEDDYAFAEKRRGRGGFDPISDAHYAETRFARRRRSVAGLAAFIVLATVLGVVVGGWTWWIPLVGVGLMAVYLVNLRRTVRAEQELRARRIRRMKMARLGVRHRDDDELGIPQRLRRPGAVVVELDDEDPDFADLPYAEYEFDEDDYAPATRARVS
nr:gephyrin-like molybdotransferase receptor GlpR [Corynebacterium lactis]